MSVTTEPDPLTPEQIVCWILREANERIKAVPDLLDEGFEEVINLEMSEGCYIAPVLPPETSLRNPLPLPLILEICKLIQNLLVVSVLFDDLSNDEYAHFTLNPN